MRDREDASKGSRTGLNVIIDATVKAKTNVKHIQAFELFDTSVNVTKHNC